MKCFLDRLFTGVECGEMWEREADGQAADIGDRVVPQCLGAFPVPVRAGTSCLGMEDKAGVP